MNTEFRIHFHKQVIQKHSFITDSAITYTESRRRCFMDHIEEKIIEIIDANRETIIAAGRDIWYHAELGYKEFRTSELFAKAMAGNAETKTGLAITGVKSYLKPKQDGEVRVALMGELDALPISNHKDTNPETGASHCCGHNSQIAGVIGAAIALQDEEVKNALDGNIVFFAVPAEEYVDVEYRRGLMKEGKISYGGGKCELIKCGDLDDIDITVGHHTMPGTDAAVANGTSNGFVNKLVTFRGKASHAAGAPDKGVDALAAASVAMHAIDVQRESFRDSDCVRVHGFISNGGVAMNVIADTATMEYSVRANNIPAYQNASQKFDRAIRAGAVATGAGAEIVTLAGYLPTVPLKDTSVMAEAISDVMQAYNYRNISLDNDCPASTGSTDYGDVSSLMPVYQFNTGGYAGVLHDISAQPVDEELAYVVTAKIFALMGYKLLKNGAENARKTLADYTPKITKEAYVALMDSLTTEETVAMNPIAPLE